MQLLFARTCSAKGRRLASCLHEAYAGAYMAYAFSTDWQRHVGVVRVTPRGTWRAVPRAMTYFDLAALAVTALAAVWDLRTSHIPNRLTLGALALAFLAHAIEGGMNGGVGGSLRAIVGALVGALVCASVPTIVFFLRGIGGGDVKLFAALGAWCPLHRGLEAETYSFVVALMIAPAYLAYRGRLLSTFASALMLIARPIFRQGARPAAESELATWFRLAPAIFAGTCIAIYLGP